MVKLIMQLERIHIETLELMPGHRFGMKAEEHISLSVLYFLAFTGDIK